MSDPHVLGDDLAPTPFTADEIRRGCPVGRTIRMLAEVEGEPRSVTVSRFAGVDEAGATIERQRLSWDGEPVGAVEVQQVTWAELQAHAAFPASQTSITPETISTPLGELACLRYSMVDGALVETFWFARSAPGMPVMYTRHEAGTLSSTVTMIVDERS